MTECNQSKLAVLAGSTDPCPICGGHGGTYEIHPRTGEIVGVPCKCIEDGVELSNEDG